MEKNKVINSQSLFLFSYLQPILLFDAPAVSNDENITPVRIRPEYKPLPDTWCCGQHKKTGSQVTSVVLPQPGWMKYVFYISAESISQEIRRSRGQITQRNPHKAGPQSLSHYKVHLAGRNLSSTSPKVHEKQIVGLMENQRQTNFSTLFQK